MGFFRFGSMLDTTPDHSTVVRQFKLAGDVWPLLAMEKAAGASAAADSGYRPSRPMGGWLCTYGKVGPDGGIVPTVDRDGHIFDAARQIGFIDWNKYMAGGVWNDTHTATVVGLPDNLEFHDGQTALSKAHGKVGFWTTGHLFDRSDPKSWQGLSDEAGKPRAPTPHEFQRADYFWSLSNLLKGTPRPIGLSAEGMMALSQCKKRVLWASMVRAAVCETPVNPDATVEPMIYAVIGRALVGESSDPSPCGKCACPAGSCNVMRKSATGGAVAGAIPQYADGGKVHRSLGSPTAAESVVRNPELRARVLELLQQEYFLDRADAEAWLTDWLRKVSASQPSTPSTQEKDHVRST